jgi:hypothetical protein
MQIFDMLPDAVAELLSRIRYAKFPPPLSTGTTIDTSLLAPAEILTFVQLVTEPPHQAFIVPELLELVRVIYTVCPAPPLEISMSVFPVPLFEACCESAVVNMTVLLEQVTEPTAQLPVQLLAQV